jgi:hypothetical protein
VDCVTETGFLLVRSKGGGDSVRALDIDFKDSFPWTVVLNTSSISSSTSTSSPQLRQRRNKKEEDTETLRTAMKEGEEVEEEVEEPESEGDEEPEVFADGYIHVWGVNNPPQTIPGIPERIIRAVQKVAMHRLLLSPPREEVEAEAEAEAEAEREGRGVGTGKVEQEVEGEEKRGEEV